MARVRTTEGPADQTRERLGVTLFLIAAAGSFLLSIALWFTGQDLSGIERGSSSFCSPRHGQPVVAL